LDTKAALPRSPNSAQNACTDCADAKYPQQVTSTALNANAPNDLQKISNQSLFEQNSNTPSGTWEVH